MTYPDTNYVLRYLLQDHPEHFSLASAYWNEVREDRETAVLTEGVLMESVYVLQKFYKVPKPLLTESLKGLLAYPGLKQEPAGIFSLALDIFTSTNLDFVDCLLSARERRGFGKIMTFEKGLRGLSPKAGG